MTGRRINKTLKACTLTECNWYCHAATALCYPIIIDPPGKKCFLPAVWDFPGGSAGKESACSAEDQGLIPELGSCGEGNGNPFQYSCHLGNPMDRGTWRAVVHGVAKSQTWLNNSQFHFHQQCINFWDSRREIWQMKSCPCFLKGVNVKVSTLCVFIRAWMNIWHPNSPIGTGSADASCFRVLTYLILYVLRV